MAHVSPRDRAELTGFEFIFEGAEKALGAVPNSMLTMGHKPAILGAFSILIGSIFHRYQAPLSRKTLRLFWAFFKAARRRDPENEISPQLAQLIAHVGSLASGCRYCQAHTADAMGRMRVPQEKIEALIHYDTSPEFTDSERAALRLAFAAGSVPNQSNESHFAELRKHFNDKQIVEIVSVIALFGFLNRWNDTMATALEGHPREFAESHLAESGWVVGKHGGGDSL